MPRTEGLLSSLVPNAKSVPMKTGNSTEYDAIPNMLAFVKSVQNNDSEGARRSLSIIHGQKGQQTATDLMFLAKSLQHSKINDIAKNNIGNEQNPEMRKLYHLVNENPDIINKFEYFIPSTGGGLASSLAPR
jgi:hypothetical protein